MAGRNKSRVRGPQLRKLVENKVVYVVICAVVWHMKCPESVYRETQRLSFAVARFGWSQLHS
jgi:hypothetical protein